MHLLLFTVIGVPLAFVWIMGGIEMFFDKGMDWRRRLMKEGWDTCVMSLGLTGGLFADPEILSTLYRRSLYTPIGWLLLSVIVSLATAVIVAFFRRQEPPTGWAAMLCLLLGGCTLLIPIYLVLLR